MPVDERVLTTIPNVTLKAGLLGIKSRQHTLVLTSDRILFARMTTARMKQLAHDAGEQARGQGKGHLAQIGAQSHGFDALSQAYLAMTPAQILAENPDNFAVDRASVSKVKVKQTGSAEGGVATDTLVIKSTDKTYKLTLMSVAQAKRALVEAGLIQRGTSHACE